MDTHAGTLYEDIGSVAGALKQQQANKVGPAVCRRPHAAFACAVLALIAWIGCSLGACNVQGGCEAAAAASHHTHTLAPLQGPARRTSRSSVASLSGMVPRSLTLRSKSAPAIDEAGLRTPVASCTGNWLSHLDWGSERCAITRGRAPAGNCCCLYV